MNKIVKKRFDIEVTQQDKIFSKSFELDKDIVSIRGLTVTSDRDDLLYFRGSQRIEINRDEIFPDDYESKLLMSGVNAPVGSRYYDLGNVNPGNKSIKIDYKDTQNPMAFFQPYRVSYYFECEKCEMA
ncbi:MAG: hypothetical protein IT233_10610 [Bacteroidia bacterium]|nr:hypothetical protein [Bacteroidia bacterium]MCC7303081.1 hypothetical protein [Bacteroidia bacterium]